MNGIPDKARFEVEESPIYKALVAELNDQGILDSKNNYIVRDRAMASGQIIKLVEDGFVWNGVNPNDRVCGCEMHKMDVQYAVHKHKLQGTYVHTGD